MKFFLSLKICFLTPFPPKESGVAEYSKYIVDSLQREVSMIFVISQVISSHLKSCGCVIGKNVQLFEVWKPNSLLNQLFIFRLIKRLSPDVVHIQYGPYSDYGGLLGEPLLFLIFLLRLSRIPCVVTLHSVWSLHEAKVRAYERIQNNYLAKIASMYYYFFMKIFLKSCNLILVCVNFTRSAVIQQIIDIFNLSKSKVHPIIHGSSCSYLNDSINVSKLKSNSCKIRLLCVGFVRPDKGYEYAIEALALLKKKNFDSTLIIAGTPKTDEGWNYLSFLKEKVKQLELIDDVIFDIKYLKKEQLYAYFASSDLLLLPYSRRVGPSGPLAIAATFALPTIMTIDKNFALDNQEAFVKLVKPNDSQALASAIEDLFNNDLNLKKMTEEASSFSSKYSFNEIAKQHLSFYFSILNNP